MLYIAPEHIALCTIAAKFNIHDPCLYICNVEGSVKVDESGCDGVGWVIWMVEDEVDENR